MSGLSSARHPDDWLFDHRAPMIYLALVLGLFLLLTPAWPSGASSTWPWITTIPLGLSERATLLLALGTFALGYAAIVQAISAERARLYRQSPGLEWRPRAGVVGIGQSSESIYVSTLGSAPGLELRNHGPGTATRLRVRYAIGLVNRTALPNYVAWPLFSQQYLDYDLREDPLPLAVGEERPVRIFDEIKSGGHDTAFNDGAEQVVAQIVAECRCCDAEGNPGRAAYIGLKRNLKAENLADRNRITNDEWLVMDSADTEFLLLNLRISMKWGLSRPLSIGPPR